MPRSLSLSNTLSGDKRLAPLVSFIMFKDLTVYVLGVFSDNAYHGEQKAFLLKKVIP